MPLCADVRIRREPPIRHGTADILTSEAKSAYGEQTLEPKILELLVGESLASSS